MRSLVLVLLLLIAGLTVLATAQAARYVPPPVGRLMLNVVLPPQSTSAAALPLYLEKTGRYYAEIYVEGADATPSAVATPTPLSFRFVFARGERVLHERAVDVVLTPGEQHKTLFWLEAPADMPARRELVLAVQLQERPPSLAGKTLRLQITRKLEPWPLLPP